MNKFKYIVVIIGILFSIGCTGEEKVPVERHFWVPNSFSDNGDGINDSFYITPVYGVAIQEFHLTIYNGQLKEVFRSDDFFEYQNNLWNGTLDNAKLPAGFYEYQIIYTAAEDSVNFKPYVTASTINLMR